MVSRTYSLGFTLSELLISLALLGLIATFAVPKLLQTFGEHQKKTILKEAIGMASDAAYTACLENKANTTAEFRDAIQQSINAPKICTDEVACGVNTFPNQGQSGKKIYVMHNGAVMKVGSGTTLDFDIDYDGNSGPNTYGQDRLRFYANPVGVTFMGESRPCVTYSNTHVSAANFALWRSLF